MAFGLPFVGGFAHASSEAKAGQGDSLGRALQILRLRQAMEMDPLRQAYYLSRLAKPAKPTPKGAGIRMTDRQGKQSVWYPATGDVSTPPAGTSFATTQQSPITKSFQQFLDSKHLTRDKYLALAPPQTEALYKEYRTTLSPDEALKDELMRARLSQLGQSMGITSKMEPLLLDVIKQEQANAKAGGTPSDVIPGVAAIVTGGGFDPSDASTYYPSED